MQKPRYEDMYGSEYLAPEDIPLGGLRVQFYKFDVRELNCAAAQKKWKVVLFAKYSDGKPMKKIVAVNKTSAKQLAKAWGKPVDDYALWMGKPADLTHVKIKAFGTLKDAVLITPIMKAVEGQEFSDDTGEVFGDDGADAEAIQQPQRQAPPMQRGSDLKQPQQRRPPASHGPIDDNDLQQERSRLAEEVDAQLSGDGDDVITTSIDAVEEKTGKTPKGKAWTRYDILTPKGRLSTFDAMIAGHAREHLGGALVKLQYEVVKTKSGGTAMNCLGILS